MKDSKAKIGCKDTVVFLRVLFLCAVLSSMLASCGPARKTCSVIVPPKVSIKSPIAVLGFNGSESYSKELSGKIESLLVNSRWKGKSVYEVVDRQNIDKVIGEIKKTNESWLFDPEKAARAGKLAGASTVIVGEVLRADVVDSYAKKEQQKCLKWKKGASDFEKALGIGCKEWEPYYIPCVSRKAYFSFGYKVIDVATSRIVHTEVLENTSDQTEHCNSNRIIGANASPRETSEDSLRRMLSGEGSGTLQEETDALKEAMSKGVTALSRNISVHSMDAAIKTSSAVKPCEEALNLGSAYITPQVQLWDKACPIWETAYQNFPNSSELAYNLGLCSEVKGNYKEAMYYYDTAYENMVGIDEDVVGARQRVMAVMNKKME